MIFWREHERVELKQPMPQDGLESGATGVEHVHAQGRASEVEFFDQDSSTIAVMTVDSDDLQEKSPP